MFKASDMTTIKQLSKFVYEVEKESGMNISPRIYADEEIIGVLKEEDKDGKWSSLQQMKNMSTLPGLVNFSVLADVHPGYGAPIGSAIVSNLKEGVITFGGVGFDINCGVHSLVVPLKAKEVAEKKKELADALYRGIPAGVGSTGELKLSNSELDEVMVKGAEFVVARGFGSKKDLKFIEENGRMEGANPKDVSDKARKRVFDEIGTLGSGNHYCEVQEVEQVFDSATAKAFGLEKGGTMVSIHCGSRALGHQIGTDYLTILDAAVKKYNIPIKDREMVCAPIESEEGKQFFSAVKAGTNAAFANRQVLGSLVKRIFAKVYGIDEDEVETFYDIGHNTAKVETHKLGQKNAKLLVQRKGSTRGFGPGREEVPLKYRKVGQPVLVGGTMGTNSFILKGTEKAMQETFGSTIHGAGRAMSRTKATKNWSGEEIVKALAEKGIIVKSRSLKGISEEAPSAYKDILSVVEVMHGAGISEKVAKLKPMICVKG